MTYLFNRRVVVNLTTIGLRIEGLDVRFSISMDEKNFGKAEISVYNLNSTHRKEVENAKGVEVELLAGYTETELTLLCKGVMREAYSIHEGEDWVTTLRTGDGDKASKARINRSYSSGTSLSLVWKDLVDSVKAQGVGVGNAIEKFKEGEFQDGITELLNGGAVQGGALQLMRKMAKAANLDMSIQDGELLLTAVGEPAEATAVKLTSNTGLIGSPQKGIDGQLKIRALIVPGLKPKRKVQIESSLVSGLYAIQKAAYKGDTSSNDWYADLECKEV